MNTATDPKCVTVSKFSSVMRALMWSGFGISIAAATAYDVRYWVFG